MMLLYVVLLVGGVVLGNLANEANIPTGWCYALVGYGVCVGAYMMWRIYGRK